MTVTNDPGTQTRQKKGLTEMGCWNETCALTGLPIMVGETIWAFPITQKYPGDPVHCDGTFAPILPPFKGTYDDYGNVEEVVVSGEAAATYMKFDFYRIDDDGTESPTRIKPPKVDDDKDAFFRGLIEAANHEVVQWVRPEDGSHGRLWVVFVRERFHDMAQIYTKDDVARAISEYEPRFKAGYGHWPKPERFAMAKLWAFMNRTRISWHPTTGAGSQNGVEEETLALYNAMHEEARWLYAGRSD